MNKYELRNEDGELIRVFASIEEATKMLTSGDTITVLKIKLKPKLKPYEFAMAKVGECML